MDGVPVPGGLGRDVLRVLAGIVGVLTVALVTMAAAAGGASVATMVLIGSTGLMVATPGVVGRRRTRERRRLARRVGDPGALTGAWRRLLLGAWTARDEFDAVVDALGSSPLADRLDGHRPVVDAALVRCGALARDGDTLARQLRGFRTRRLRYDLMQERIRDPQGTRARMLADRLAEVERLSSQVDAVHGRLEAQVHDLRTAAWRATTLRTDPGGDGALRDLLADLVHLREALEELDDDAAGAAAPQPRERTTDGPPGAAATAPRYDVGARRSLGG